MTDAQKKNTQKQDDSLAVVILAAGKGSRMKSDKPKVLHELAGRPLISWLLESVELLSPEKIIVVTAPDMDDVRDIIAPHHSVVQKQARGTGDAVKAALPALDGHKGDVLVLLGDTPLLAHDTLQDLIDARHLDNAGLSVLGVELDDPHGYGRLVPDKKGKLVRIVEQKDCTAEEEKLTVVNTGAFCVAAIKLAPWLEQLSDENSQNEYYFTDLPAIARAEGYKTEICISYDEDEVAGINSRAQLAAMEAIVQNALRHKAMDNGATLLDPESVYFSWDSEIGRDVVIEPHVYFGPKVRIADNVRIKAFSHLEDCTVQSGADIGPFARLRPGADIGEKAKIGNFVEVKNTKLGAGSKVSHLSYVGDGDIGTGVNIGAGTIFCNYDGFDKHKTTIGDGAFIGSNSTLIAPVKIGENALVAGGSIVVKPVPSDALYMTRPEAVIKDGWAMRFKNMKNQKKKIG
jgi:bifunctional UDP-N-acetylglucosamine pyrophosphorylase/glucosamine-1-phosphate N-acetyltransferase